MNGKRPVEDELRSSQVYSALKKSGSVAADLIAEGLGAAAQGLDAALNSAGVRQAAQASGQSGNRQNAKNAWSHGYQYTVNRQPTPSVQNNKQPQPAPAPQVPMKVVRKGSPAKFYIASAVALFYSFNFPMYKPIHFIGMGIAVIASFILAGGIFRGKKEYVPIEQPKPKPEPKPAPQPKQEEPKSETGDPEVDKIIKDGRNYLKRLRAANDAIPDEALTADIDRMERASADIFAYIAEHPDKAPQIRKFMNYYLPTTLKLLNSYQRLSAQSAKGENITSTMFNITGMMHTVADAFEKQLDSLFTEEAMDVSADISVFETLLKQEGFVEEKKKAVKTETKPE